LLMLVNVLYWNLLVPQPPLTLPSLEPWQLPRTKVHAVLFFKEESHALVEVLLNLYSQGLDHVVLVDNMSVHPLPYNVIDLLRRKNFVTLWHDPHKMAQKRAYAKASQLSRWKGADWLIAVDADEFPYATQLGRLQAYLTLRDSEVCSIAIPFRMFGSDGREEQPNSLVHGFVWRSNTTLKVPAYKTVSRMGCTLWMAIHHAGILPKDALNRFSAIAGFDRDDSPTVDERLEAVAPDLVTNHYRYQSHKFYLDIKGTRGKSLAVDPQRDETTFRAGNHNHTLDFTLRDKVMARFPSLYGPADKGKDDLALQSNLNYTSPWPLKNVQAALQELERHQVLVIMDADNTLPDTLGIATRNAAILDPTLDCVVRVPPGHVESVIHSKLLVLCKAVEAHPETQSWQDFVQAMVHTYQSHYKGFVAVPQHVRLPEGLETAPLRKAAIAASTSSQHWPTYDLTKDIQVQVCSSSGYDGGRGKR